MRLLFIHHLAFHRVDHSMFNSLGKGNLFGKGSTGHKTIDGYKKP